MILVALRVKETGDPHEVLDRRSRGIVVRSMRWVLCGQSAARRSHKAKRVKITEQATYWVLPWPLLDFIGRWVRLKPGKVFLQLSSRHSCARASATPGTPSVELRGHDAPPQRRGDVHLYRLCALCVRVRFFVVVVAFDESIDTSFVWHHSRPAGVVLLVHLYVIFFVEVLRVSLGAGRPPPTPSDKKGPA